jgi:Kelch motif/Galactose oxidase, central domain
MTEPTPERGTLGTVAHHLIETVRPLADAFSDPDAFSVLLRELGWQVPGLPPAYATVADKVTQAVNAVDALADGATVEEIVAVIGKAGDVYRAVAALTVAPQGIDATQFLTGLARQLFEYLLGRQLLAEAPDWYAALEALGIITTEFVPAAGARTDYVRFHFDWDQIPALLSDLSLVPERVFGWGTPNLAFAKIVELLAELVAGFGLLVSLDQLSDEEVAPLHAGATGPLDRSANLGMTVVLGDVTLPDGSSEPLGLQLTGLPADGGALPGMILQPRVPDGVDLDVPLSENWTLRIRAGTDLKQQLALFVRPGEVGARFPGAPGQELPSAGFGVSLVFAPEEATRLFGQPGQTRLELTGATIEAAAEVRAGEPELSVRGEVDGLALVVSAAGADGFLGTILGDNDFRVTIPAELAWSSRSGLRFATGAGLELTVNPNLDLGFVRVDSAKLAIAAEAGSGVTPALAVRATATFSGRLGPFAYVVDGFGAALPITFTDGNAGPFDVDLRVQPPTGAGLSVDAGVVAGGGFLSFDAERGEYAGALELELADFLEVKAIGLISTRQPDGSRGFSLLLVLTAEFPTGLQLGAGFTLLAVGGLVGLNRGMNLQALVEGVRSGAIESVAFPKDLIANAPRILSDLNRFFPVEQGTFVVGPMVKIGWGTPTLISVSLGVIIEIPGDIAVLGVVRVALPTADAPLLLVQAQFVGALELDKSRMWFFATLFQSRILGMNVEGGMGVLVSWGDSRDLVITVGGFHPAFRPPPLPFPVPGRLAVPLLNRGGQLVRLTGYFAITPNTIQFGGDVEVRLGFSAFRVEGHLGVDALIQRSPFRFTAHTGGDVSLKVFGIGVFTIGLDFTLEGPAPFRAHGRGSIGFLFFSVSANFDFEWGPTLEAFLPPVIVLDLLVAELNKPEGWETRLPSGGRRSLVSLRALPGTDDLVLHPLGTLTITQRALPLNVRVDRVGGQKASDGKRFTVAPADGSGLRRVADTADRFAMAQFQDMSDAAKLSRPSYETQDAGLELTAEGNVLATARVVRRAARYELHVIGDEPEQVSALATSTTVATPVKRFHSVPVFDELRPGASISRSPLSARVARQKQPFAAADTVRVDDQRFVVAYVKSNRQAFPPSRPGRPRVAATFRSRATAEDALADFVTDDPALTGRLHVIPAAEAAITPGAPGTWLPAGTLPVPVSTVDLVTLPSGAVLVAGGTDTAGGPSAATALFDPTADSWAAGPPLGAARQHHSTTGLPDGRVLVAGGADTPTAELFDPAERRWTPTPPMVATREGHSATLLPDGRVLVAGGRGGLTSAELYDPRTGTWHETGSMTDARTDHRAVLLNDGRVLAVGGALPTSPDRADPLAYCEVYDPTTGEWTTTGPLREPRTGHQAVLLADHRVLVTGGDPVPVPRSDGTFDPHSLASAELYDPKTEMWQAAPPMPGGGRSGHRALTLRSGAVLVTGGTGAPERTAAYRSVLAFDAGTWSTVDGLITGRSAHAMAELADDRVLVAAGAAGTGEVLIP